MIDKITFKIDEAASFIGIGRTKIYELINAGEIPLVKLAGRSLIRRSDLERLVDRHVILRAG